MKALVIGATGATGKDLVEILLRDEAYTEVAIFVRRATGITHPKLTEHIIDLREPEAHAALITGDVWFSCLGTTLEAAGSKEAQWQIDFGMPAAFGAIARRNGVRCCVLLSAYGADASSRIFYSKMKGELENHLRMLRFDRYVIFRPGLLLRRDSDRPSERLFAGLLRAANTLGLFRRFRGMPTTVLAAKMAAAGKRSATGEEIIGLDRIFSY